MDLSGSSLSRKKRFGFVDITSLSCGKSSGVKKLTSKEQKGKRSRPENKSSSSDRGVPQVIRMCFKFQIPPHLPIYGRTLGIGKERFVLMYRKV